jgi:hypothetical protein
MERGIIRERVPDHSKIFQFISKTPAARRAAQQNPLVVDTKAWLR